MFNLSQSATFWWPVTVMLPKDGGGFDKATFDAEFRRKSDTELKAIRTRVEGDELTDAAFVREVLAGWRGVSDGADELAFSETALARLLDVPGVAAAVVIAYVESQSGLKRKN